MLFQKRSPRKRTALPAPSDVVLNNYAQPKCTNEESNLYEDLNLYEVIPTRKDHQNASNENEEQYIEPNVVPIDRIGANHNSISNNEKYETPEIYNTPEENQYCSFGNEELKEPSQADQKRKNWMSQRTASIDVHDQDQVDVKSHDCYLTMSDATLNS